jgi:tetratricopeptide (TPR) repeat protein
MFHQPSKYLYLAAFSLLAPAWVTGQDKPAAGQPQYKDPGEFTLYDSILKDTTPKTRLEKLQDWQTKYASTDFEKQREQLFLDTYIKLNEPKEAVAEAKQILADNPKDFTSLYYTMYFTRALAGDKPTPDVLEQGEKAAAAIVANIDTPPPNVTADQWKGARTPVETLGHSTLGWIAMQRENWDAAEAEFQKSLALDANNGELDYFMGTVLASEKRREKLSAELFYFARAASYEGTGALAPAGRQQVMDFVKKAYVKDHGSEEGFNDLVAMAKAQAAPPADYHNQDRCRSRGREAEAARDSGREGSSAYALEAAQSIAHRGRWRQLL